jgi:hypothetical protein
MNRPCVALTLVLVVGLGVTRTARADERTDQQRRVDASITAALARLATMQQPSGAWELGMQPNRGFRGGSESTAATSLAVMAFLAAGHVPGEGPYGPQLEHAIRWVVDRQHENGLLFVGRDRHGSMYEHGISTLMLAEASGMVNEADGRRVRAALEKAIDRILQGQMVDKADRQKGGWRYMWNSNDSDLSVTGWQLLALRAAKDVGCDVPAENIDLAVEYVKKCSAGTGGFTYQPGPGVTTTRSGTGILCLEVCGEHHARESLAAADYVLLHPLRADDQWFFYGAYYCTVGMFKMGGDYWERTRDHVGETLLADQNNDGTWTPRNNEGRGGIVYATSLSVLALAVEYQYLPIYQR